MAKQAGYTPLLGGDAQVTSAGASPLALTTALERDRERLQSRRLSGEAAAAAAASSSSPSQQQQPQHLPASPGQPDGGGAAGRPPAPLPPLPPPPLGAGALSARRAGGGLSGAPRPPPHALGPKPKAPGQPAAPARSKDRFISLPDGIAPAGGAPGADDDAPRDDAPGLRGRITAYCVAEGIDRRALEARLRARGGRSLENAYPDVLHGRIEMFRGGALTAGDALYFDYGVVVFWGLSERQEREVLRGVVAPSLVDALEPRDAEADEFAYHYTATDKPHVINDVFTIGYKLRDDPLIKLSISHALAQSTKLSVYEKRVMDIVDETRDLPERLATSGEVRMGRKQVAQLIGRVFIQKSAVNLLSTVLDTPEFFWSAPDAMQTLYKRCCEYVEYDARVEVLNSRFGVLHEMLDMVRDHVNYRAASRLEWIVIWLIVVEVVVGLFESASILGWWGRPGPG